MTTRRDAIKAACLTSLKDHPVIVGAIYGTAAGLVALVAAEALWWILP